MQTPFTLGGEKKRGKQYREAGPNVEIPSRGCGGSGREHRQPAATAALRPTVSVLGTQRLVLLIIALTIIVSFVISFLSSIFACRIWKAGAGGMSFCSLCSQYIASGTQQVLTGFLSK